MPDIKGSVRMAAGVFDDRDYASNDGMMTRIWGPALWHSLHTISFNYPVKPTRAQKEHHAAFLCTLGKVLPCGHCRRNFPANLAAVGFTNAVFADRASFSRFVYALHNKVNDALGKPSRLTYGAVRDRYEAFRSRCLEPHDGPGVPDRHCAAAGPAPATATEDGCVEPLHAGTKARCVLRIVPETSAHDTFAVDPTCAVARSAPPAPPATPTPA